MKDNYKLDLDNGKYSILFNEQGAVTTCLRYGEVSRPELGTSADRASIFLRWLASYVRANREGDPLDIEKLREEGACFQVVYDNSNSFPVRVLYNGEPWLDVLGDNVIFWLMAEIRGE